MGIMVNPFKIKKSDLPLIVLADDRRGFLGWLIKAHSHGNYNHIMEMHEPGHFVSQEVTGYKEIPIERYTKSYIHLKFWSCKELTDKARKSWLDIIQADLDAPWKFKIYDFLGIVGQFLHIRWLNNPHLKYCSERVASHLRLALLMDIFRHPTPNDLNKLFKKDKRFEVYGYWFSD